MALTFPAQKKPDYPDTIAPQQCLAKTIKLRNGQPDQPGCNVYTHLYAACAMFRQLASIWQGTRRGEFFFPQAEWAAALHDIGKMAPGFQDKIYRALHCEMALPWKQEINETRRHSGNSAIILEEFFQDKHSSQKRHSSLIRIVGGHHGTFYDLKLGDSIDNVELGGPEWQMMRNQFLDRLVRDLKLPECDLNSIPPELFPLMLGSVILADWLSSSLDLKPDSPLPDDALLKQVVESAGLVPHEVRDGLNFHTIFEFLPNSLQSVCLNQIVPGGIYVVESGMGSGKTEAALAIAYELMRKKQADGIYFALPTQLTSEKIFKRLNSFLEKTVCGCDLQSILIHGDSWLNWDLPDQDENGRGNDAGSWFQSKKRALLASFGAGTVDQSLMAVVRVRYNALRAFALAGKVVIFDEIHSYDAYTGSLLAELIGSLRNWGCTVILLSATLTSEACRKFAQMKELPSDDCYPRLLVNDHDRISIFHVDPPEAAEVDLCMTADEDLILQKAVARARTGEQVLWIENTVPQAQQFFRRFTALAPDLEIGLIHSRFPVCVRSINEDYWTGLLGKNGASVRRENGRILVATQVLEQSVDVDADLLITRIAPADFLFQRIGRLWRHSCLNGVRPPAARRQTIILAPEFLADPESVEKEKRSFLPYDAYWIRRTWEALHGKSKLELPADIRPVLEDIYREREEESDSLKNLKTDIAAKNEKLQLYANVASAKIGDMQNDETFAATRFSEEDQVQLLLLRKGNLGEKCNSRIHPFFGSGPIGIPASDAPRKQRVAAARRILPMMLKIPERHAPDWEDFPADFLRGILWTGDDAFHPVRLAYIDEAGRILDQSCNVVSKNGFQFAYHEKQGYISRKIEEGK